MKAGLQASSNSAAAINAAVNSVATQGVLLAAGLQEKFSWKSVAASAVAAAVSNQIGKSIIGENGIGSDGKERFNPTEFAKTNLDAAKFVTGLVSGVTGAYIRHGITNNAVNFRDVAADSVGNALADTIIGGLSAPSAQ